MSHVYRRPFDYRPHNQLGIGFRVIAYAAGAMVGVASLSFGESGTVTGTGSLAASEALTLTASATANNNNPNALEGSAPLALDGVGTLTASGALAGADALTLGASATLSGTNLYQPYMWPKARKPWPPGFDFHQWSQNRWTIFPYSVSTATAGIGSLAIDANAILRGTGALATSTPITLDASGTLLAGGNLEGSGALTFGQSADLTSGATGSITALQGFEFGASGTLTGTGALYGPADLSMDATASYQVLIPPSGNAGVVLGATGRLTNATAGAGTVTDIYFSVDDGMEIFFSA